MTRGAWLAIGSIAAGSGAMLAGIGLMASSGYLISRAAERPPIVDLMLIFVAVRFFGLARPALRYAERIASHELTFRLLKVVRTWFAGALLPLSAGQLAQYRSGDLLSRLASDVDALQESYLRVIAPALVAVIVAMVTAAGLAFADVRIAAIVTVMLIVFGVAYSWLAYRQARDMGARRNAIRRDFSADLVAVVQGIDDVLTSGGEERLLARLGEHQRRLDALESRDARALAVHASVGVLIMLVGAWIVLFVSVRGAAAGAISPIWIAPWLLVGIAAFECVEGLPAAWQSAGQIRDSAQRVLDVIRTPPAVAECGRPVPLGAMAPGIELARVTFGYAHTSVLRDVSLRIHPGEHVAVIGATGAGKSTFLALLARAWDPVAGAVCFDGVDLRLVDLEDLRAHTAWLPQHVHVFNDTLRENVRLPAANATDDEIIDVLSWAGLGPFLDRAPQGLGTVLGEQGTRMSAGERQRLGLARIFLTNATLVLADEPTANLDPRSERNLLETLSAWARHRTLVLVSHRPAARRYVNRVLRLERGTIAAR
jgi:thiol reductant ABC exporter CydC subunit